MTIVVNRTGPLPLAVKAGGGFESALTAGVLLDGDTITLNAGGYGAGPTLVAASRFENIPVGGSLDGAAIEQGYKPTFSIQAGTVQAADDRAHSGTRSAKVVWGSSTISAFGFVSMNPGTNALRIQYQRFQDYNYNTVVTDANLKQFYVFGTQGELPQAILLIPAGENSWSIYNNGDVGHNGGGPKYLGLSDVDTEGEWQLWDIYIENNSAVGVADGKFHVDVNGRRVLENNSYIFNQVNSVHGSFDDFRLGHMAQQALQSIVWYDELIVHEGRQAIYVSASATWDDSVEQELACQAVGSWTDGSISFNFNRSALPANVPLYAHVRKADGTMLPAEAIGQL